MKSWKVWLAVLPVDDTARCAIAARLPLSFLRWVIVGIILITALPVLPIVHARIPPLRFNKTAPTALFTYGHLTVV